MNLNACRLVILRVVASLLEGRDAQNERDEAAAATELRRPAPLRSFCASRLSDATRRMMRLLAFIFPRVDLNLKGRDPQS